jgi:hypothetical protein
MKGLLVNGMARGVSSPAFAAIMVQQLKIDIDAADEAKIEPCEVSPAVNFPIVLLGAEFDGA